MEQLILHLFGDYVTQSDWMAQNKTKAYWPALAHAIVYSLPFLALVKWDNRGGIAWGVIFWTHLFIDRYRLARYVVWAKNWLGPSRKWAEFEPYDYWKEKLDGDIPQRLWEGSQPTLPWRFCTKTGYPPSTPDWLAFWLLIVADNTLHLAINYTALRWL
jgi:hypothetical protein